MGNICGIEKDRENSTIALECLQRLRPKFDVSCCPFDLTLIYRRQERGRELIKNFLMSELQTLTNEVSSALLMQSHRKI